MAVGCDSQMDRSSRWKKTQFPASSRRSASSSASDADVTESEACAAAPELANPRWMRCRLPTLQLMTCIAQLMPVYYGQMSDGSGSGSVLAQDSKMGEHNLLQWLLQSFARPSSQFTSYEGRGSLPPPGQRSGAGARSIEAYLGEARNSRPAPVE